jgi:hypothetical protein
MRDFETGEFSWNKVVATNDFGESTMFYLEKTENGVELSLYDMENSKKGALKEKGASNLSKLKGLVSEMNIISN